MHRYICTHARSAGMAENLTQYKTYPSLLSVLQQHGLPKEAICQVSDTVAEIVAEALQNGHARTQQQKQPAVAPPATPLQDLQTADAVLQGVSLIIPRGKFDVGFFPASIQVSNKQTSAVIPYNSIQHVLVIDAIPKHPNTTNLVLVMKNGQPVQQGRNQLDMVVIQTKDQPELSLPAPEACEHLGDTLAGPAAVVLSQLLASYIEDIQEDTFLTADSSVFSSSAGDLMIAANRGATAGWLVPLSVGLCYIGKPGTFVPSSSIAKVLFHRTGAGSSTFDVTIKLAPGAADAAAAAAKPLELGQIDAAELNKLQGYLLAQRIRIGAEDDDDDQDKGEAAAAAAPAAGRAAAAAAAAPDDDDDDDEEDDDYDPEAADDERHSSKKQKTEQAGGEEEGEDDEEEEEPSEDGSDDDSGDVSLVDEDAMDEDSDEDDE